MLLWQEYKEGTPSGYQYSQFCELYRQWRKKLDLSMRQEHHAGEKFFVDHNAASGLMEPDNLFRLLEQYNIEATLLRTQSAATKLLDRIDGWQKIYSDDIATIHLRKAGAMHTKEPAVNAKLK